MTAVLDPGAAAARATDAILGDTLRGTARGIVVDSPPGAGKSTLVVRAALDVRPLLGEPIDASSLVTAASEVHGVIAAVVDALQRRDGGDAAVPSGVLAAAPWEILRPVVHVDVVVVP